MAYLQRLGPLHNLGNLGDHLLDEPYGLSDDRWLLDLDSPNLVLDDGVLDVLLDFEGLDDHLVHPIHLLRSSEEDS